MNWIWGIRFKTYRALWVLVPFANLVMPFVLGAKGNEWAWQSNHWNSVDEFKQSQRRWSFAALLIFATSSIFLAAFHFQTFGSIEEPKATKLALDTLEKSESFQNHVGIPYDLDLVKGTKREYKLSDSAPTQKLPPNSVHMYYNIEGKSGIGMVEFEALQNDDQTWHLTCLKVTYESVHKVNILVPCENGT